MKFEVVKLDDFSGNKAAIYSIIVNDEDETLFDKFLAENEEDYPEQIENLLATLNAINTRIGYDKNVLHVRSRKDKSTGGVTEHEGRFGQGIDTLFDGPNKNLRLYLIDCGKCTIILGGGGFKSKKIKAFQEDPKLKEENYLLRRFADLFYEAIKDGDIYYSGNELEGNLEIIDYSDNE